MPQVSVANGRSGKLDPVVHDTELDYKLVTNLRMKIMYASN